ncbi:transposase [Xenorhabdus beddingii]|uniref:Transposase n=1 Tax=Xenorhabdus beddingii TaxID=40578 RepID=A0A1Y2SM04_9GAMM|nr:transposase [Xenorhabdus beddingii]
MAGQRAAMVMSLLETAKANGHDPQVWLQDVLRRLPTWPNNRLNELLPWPENRLAKSHFVLIWQSKVKSPEPYT